MVGQGLQDKHRVDLLEAHIRRHPGSDGGIVQDRLDAAPHKAVDGLLCLGWGHGDNTNIDTLIFDCGGELGDILNHQLTHFFAYLLAIPVKGSDD